MKYYLLFRNYKRAPEIPLICLNKDIFSSKIKTFRDGRKTRGISLNLYMQGTYQMDRETFEKSDAEVFFNDSCQVSLINLSNFNWNLEHFRDHI
jgi:hypothetical protein